jgi:hypothetical protein
MDRYNIVEMDQESEAVERVTVVICSQYECLGLILRHLNILLSSKSFAGKSYHQSINPHRKIIPNFITDSALPTLFPTPLSFTTLPFHHPLFSHRHILKIN